MSDELLRRLFGAIDSRDTAAFVACLTDDGSFRFGSSPPALGSDAIAGAVDAFFGSIAGLRHDIRRSVADGDTLIVEGDVTYTRHDGRQVTVPFANFMDLRGDRVNDYRVYADISPLYAD